MTGDRDLQEGLGTAIGRRRILLVIPTLVRGGAEKQLVALATGLDRDRFDVRVAVLTHSGPLESVLREHGIPIALIGKRWKIDPFAAKRLVREIETFKPHLVHTWIFAANAYGRWAAQRCRVPVILGGERCVDPWKRAHELTIDRWLAKRSTAILTNSSGVVDFYASHGISAEKFVVIPNGIDDRWVDREQARRRLLEVTGLPASSRLMVTVGRLWPQKRTNDLIWATELLGCVRDDAHLIVIGDGPQRWRLERYARQVGIAAHIHFLGERNDAAELIGGGDQFWLASGYEGQSNALLEAMVAETPVVVSDIPGNRDLIDPEVSGLMFTVGDRAAIARQARRLLDDPGLGPRLAHEAKRRVQKLSVARMVERHAELYEQWIAAALSRSSPTG